MTIEAADRFCCPDAGRKSVSAGLYPGRFYHSRAYGRLRGTCGSRSHKLSHVPGMGHLVDELLVMADQRIFLSVKVSDMEQEQCG